MSEATGNPYAIDVILPSRGQFNSELPGGKLRLRPMTVAEESMFSGASNPSAVAEKVLLRCIETPAGVDLKRLLLTDKYYLLFTLRSLTYGSDYSHKITCGCGKEYVHTLKVPDDLKMKCATKDDVEPFEVVLPMAKSTLMVRFLRGDDEERAEEYLAQLGSVAPGSGDPGYAYRMALHIVSVDKKEVSLLERLRICQNMHGRDSQTLRKAIIEKEPGMDLSITATCPVCRSPTVAVLPLTREFFR